MDKNLVLTKSFGLRILSPRKLIQPHSTLNQNLALQNWAQLCILEKQNRLEHVGAIWIWGLRNRPGNSSIPAQRLTLLFHIPNNSGNQHSSFAKVREN